MSRILRFCFYVSLSLLVVADAWAQTEREEPPGLNVSRDSAGQIAVKGSKAGPLEQARPGYGPVEVLTDTQGVDFGPYLRDAVLPTVRRNWYSVIPESVQQKKGKLAIEFAVTKDGKVAGMKLVSSSGDIPMDRAAWAGIAASSPFSSLPEEFKGSYLALRFHFYYNPDAADLAAANTTAHALVPTIIHAESMAHESDSHLPKYPKKARQEKTEGLVRLDVDVGTDGKVKDLKVLEGNPLLAAASIQAIRKWRFYPAQKDGKAVEDRARIRVDFRLDHTQVKAQVVSYADPSSGLAQ